MKKKIFLILNSILILLPKIALASGDAAYEKTATIANSALNVFSWFGYVIALGVLIMVGIKYMLGAADEKAKLKDAFPKYLIGIALVILASTVATIVAGIAYSGGDNTGGGVVDKGLELGGLEVGGSVLGTPEEKEEEQEEPSEESSGDAEEPEVEEEEEKEIKETAARKEINETAFSYWEIYEGSGGGNKTSLTGTLSDDIYPDEVIDTKQIVVPIYFKEDEYRALPTFIAASTGDGAVVPGTNLEGGTVEIIPGATYVGSGFSPRSSSPVYGDEYWMTTEYGGKNLCIEIKDGFVIPNCVGYAWGRFMEIMGGTQPNLSRGDAKTWYGNTGDGYGRGQEPRLGAVICWGYGEWGHVAIVEQINYNEDGTVKSIIVSESHYGGGAFNTREISASGNFGGAQGFIYNPAVPYE